MKKQAFAMSEEQIYYFKTGLYIQLWESNKTKTLDHEKPTPPKVYMNWYYNGTL